MERKRQGRYDDDDDDDEDEEEDKIQYQVSATTRGKSCAST